MGACLALAACSSPTTDSVESSAPASSATFPLAVSVTVYDDGNGSLARVIIETDDELDCEGVGEFGAIAEGAAVTVRDAAGMTVGLGTLGPGVDGPGWPIECVFTATVADVPDSSAFYSVQIADGPEEQVTAADARAGVELEYGEVP